MEQIERSQNNEVISWKVWYLLHGCRFLEFNLNWQPATSHPVSHAVEFKSVSWEEFADGNKVLIGERSCFAEGPKTRTFKTALNTKPSHPLQIPAYV